MWYFLNRIARQAEQQRLARRKLVRRTLTVESLETRDLLAADVRSIDGSGNNLTNLTWGAAGTDLLRLSPAAYADGISTPAASNATRPSAREISNAVADQGSEDIVSQRQLSAMSYAWGQFLDHDLDLTTAAVPKDAFPVQVPTGDASFDPNSTGTATIPLSRSEFDSNTGTSTANPRQQKTDVTAWIDGSQIYGSDAATADKLRSHVGGKLLTSDGNLLPLNDSATLPTGTLPMANDSHIVPDSQLFAAGDVRANENIELTSLHTLFMREHNRVADQLALANPAWSDEQLYQGARKIVIGELQAITYNEWLPALLGQNALKTYKGYNSHVNPSIANEFSTAAFRLGHSMLGDDVEFLDNNGMPVDDEISLSQAFFNPPELTEHGIDPILKYLASDPSSEIDSKVVGSVRNFLFGPPGAGGLDLASLNIQRGRDHGLADYNTMRASFGLPKVTKFSQITSDVELQGKLQDLYGNVNNIDAWVGMLAENHVPGSSVGPLIQKVLVDQFQRLRDGDRFWYQREFKGQQLRDIEHTTLADVMRRNTGDSNLQGNVFFFKVAISGQVFQDTSGDGLLNGRERGLAGRTVELLDADTLDVLATTTTGPKGNYQFDSTNGLGVGQFQVREVLPDGWTETSQPVSTISITRGDTLVRNVNFGAITSGTTTPPTNPCPPGPQSPTPHSPPAQPPVSQSPPIDSHPVTPGSGDSHPDPIVPPTPPVSPPPQAPPVNMPVPGTPTGSLPKPPPPPTSPPNGTTGGNTGESNSSDPLGVNRLGRGSR